MSKTERDENVLFAEAPDFKVDEFNSGRGGKRGPRKRPYSGVFWIARMMKMKKMLSLADLVVLDMGAHWRVNKLFM